MLTRILILGLLAGVAGVWYMLPPPHVSVSVSGTDVRAPHVRGAIHAHSQRSDGTGDVATIAAAATASH